MDPLHFSLLNANCALLARKHLSHDWSDHEEGGEGTSQQRRPTATGTELSACEREGRGLRRPY